MVVERGHRDSDLGGMARLRERYLAPGELVRWTAPQVPESYFVEGLRENGKPVGRWPIWARVLAFPFRIVGRAYLRVAEFFACFSDFDFSDFPRRKSQPVVLVFGSSPECMAVFRSRPSSDAGFHGVWMMTDRRFVAASFESARIRIDFEVPGDQIKFRPNTDRRFPKEFRPRNGAYHEVLLPDGSGFAIAPGAVSFAGS